MAAGNSVAVVACFPAGAKLLYADSCRFGMPQSQRIVDDTASLAATGMYRQFASVSAAVRLGISDFANTANGQDSNWATAPVALAASLTKALCVIRRRSSQRSEPSGDNRVLLLSVSPDLTAQYVSTMNCIFAAKKSNVRIDACVIGPENSSPLLQQAASLTNGIYSVCYHKFRFVTVSRQIASRCAQLNLFLYVRIPVGGS